MRIKTLKRNMTNLVNKGLLFKQNKRSEIGAPLPTTSVWQKKKKRRVLTNITGCMTWNSWLFVFPQ